MVAEIAVIGAGVIGLCSAVQLAEKYGEKVKVTILTDAESTELTSDVGAGIWTVYFLTENTPFEKLQRWGKISFDHTHNLWKSGLADETGICLAPVVHLTNQSSTMDEPHKEIMYGWNRLSNKELDMFRMELGEKYVSGSRSVVFVIESSKYLKYLTKRFKEAGGVIKRQHVRCFEELKFDYDLIVNCTGLNSIQLANDKNVFPIRGQTIRLDAPWHFYGIIDDVKKNHIIPNVQSIFLGGTTQAGNFNRNVDQDDMKFIYNGCLQFSKTLKHSKMLRNWIGLRPGRTEVRVELETILCKDNKPIRVIHNYGHGGSGITMSWGCGNDVVSIVNGIFDEDTELNRKLNSHIKSKL